MTIGLEKILKKALNSNFIIIMIYSSNEPSLMTIVHLSLLNNYHPKCYSIQMCAKM